ncbi:hypothetical protein BGZ61DRAFT_527282 [Ilyonectria robusta]|uniref:uncharacterized protein n=1 Tax=Ilyonectria robusta TaxID=1079257 RepID=UPI001E8EDE31|nr:uncharacterized protein BGZ61DRAFT_527282 [Ilyonectria robusta]KAH8736316.1 hypothetical protein BGZ61DRAFT_527282 [Ilyonectria robusta]
MYHDQDQNSDALPSSAGGFLLTRLLPRKSEETCVDTESKNTCEKSQLSGGKVMIAIIIVSIICGIGFLCFLFYLHRRRTKMEQLEDLKDVQELDDYGITSAPPSSKTKPSQMPQAPAPTHAPTPMKHQASDTRAGPPPPSYRESTDSLSPSIRQATATVPRDGLSNY